MQLGDAVALRALDRDHRRVGDVDADLDHAGRDQDVCLPRGEARHRRRFLARAHLTVENADVEGHELAGGESLGLLGRRRGLELVGLADEWADDVGLAPLSQPLADEVVGAGAVVGADDPGRDRTPARRQLAQGRDVEVAVGRQRQSARDRRGCHVQDVGDDAAGALGVECGALPDSEAVLLVDHRDREVAELDAVLDQGVGADDEAELAARQVPEQIAPALGRDRARQQRRRQRRTGEQGLQRPRSAVRREFRWAAISAACWPTSTARSIA